MYIEKIQNQRNEEIYKNKKIHEKLKRGMSQEYSSSYISKRQHKQRNNYYQITKTLFILMKSSYPTYHNNKI